MDKDEYYKAQKQLHDKFEKDRFSLAKEYALEKNSYGIGDIVYDHMGAIKIEHISIRSGDFYRIGGTLPYCIYYGPELKKDLTPKQNGHKRELHQINIGK